MDAPFNNLGRGVEYVFVFGSGCAALTGVFHEITPDGLLKVAGTTGQNQGARTYLVNPVNVIYARET